jgi:hypothetical protein
MRDVGESRAAHRHCRHIVLLKKNSSLNPRPAGKTAPGYRAQEEDLLTQVGKISEPPAPPIHSGTIAPVKLDWLDLCFGVGVDEEIFFASGRQIRPRGDSNSDTRVQAVAAGQLD